MTVKNKVEVRIAGKDYTIVGVEPEEYIQRIGLYIDRKMSEVMRSNSKLSTSLAAVLTAMNVVDDYFKSHESEINLKKEFRQLSEELESIKDQNRRLSEENSELKTNSSNLQLELAKREAELREVRNSFDKMSSPRP